MSGKRKKRNLKYVSFFKLSWCPIYETVLRELQVSLKKAAKFPFLKENHIKNMYIPRCLRKLLGRRLKTVPCGQRTYRDGSKIPWAIRLPWRTVYRNTAKLDDVRKRSDCNCPGFWSHGLRAIESKPCFRTQWSPQLPLCFRIASNKTQLPKTRFGKGS